MAQRPKLGQHFLDDARVLSNIAGAVPLSTDTQVVEIGPGEGALTAELLATGARVTAVELDTHLAARLRRRFADEDRFRLVEADVLTTHLPALRAPDGEAYVVGNLPYYIASPIIRGVLPLGEVFSDAVFLVQKEVAERIVARKGSRDYGYLSALCRLWSEPEYLFTVRAGSFRPPPKVDSAVVRLSLRRGVKVDPALIAFLKAVFRQPRKTLLNNLSSVYPRAMVSERPEAGLRAQQLDVEELTELWRALEITKVEPGASANVKSRDS